MIRPSIRRGPRPRLVPRHRLAAVAGRGYRRNRPLAAGDLRAVVSGDARWRLTRHGRLDVPGCYEIYGPEEAAMITHTTVQALGQAQLADLHDQARRDALVRAARRTRRAQRQRSRTVRPGARIPRRRPLSADRER